MYGKGITEVRALDGVDLEVEKGEFVAVVGICGSGKSTLIHMLFLLHWHEEGRFAADFVVGSNDYIHENMLNFNEENKVEKEVAEELSKIDGVEHGGRTYGVTEEVQDEKDKYYDSTLVYETLLVLPILSIE